MNRIFWLVIIILTIISARLAFGQQFCGCDPGDARCLGDRNCDGHVVVSDTQACVAMALDMGGEFCRPSNPACANDLAVAQCDLDCNFHIAINELQTVVNNNLNGCFLPSCNGYPYPIGIQGNSCTHQIFVNNHCGGAACTHANCPSCP